MQRAGQHLLCWSSGARGGRAPSLLELYWREITQRRVQPAVVVYLVDEVRKAGDDLIKAMLVAEVELLALERLHEAFRLCVIVRIAAAAH